jgi:hypothetical protein
MTTLEPGTGTFAAADGSVDGADWLLGGPLAAGADGLGLAVALQAESPNTARMTPNRRGPAAAPRVAFELISAMGALLQDPTAKR